MSVHELVALLLAQLDVRVRTGTITLNVKDWQLESYETKTYTRVKEKSIDERARISA